MRHEQQWLPLKSAQGLEASKKRLVSSDTQLTCSLALLSGIQQSDLVPYVYICISFLIKEAFIYIYKRLFSKDSLRNKKRKRMDTILTSNSPWLKSCLRPLRLRWLWTNKPEAQYSYLYNGNKRPSCTGVLGRLNEIVQDEDWQFAGAQ